MDNIEHPTAPRKMPTYMNITVWIIILGAIGAVMLMKRLNQASPSTARDWLNKGALVIDVRSEAEYRDQHLPGTINIPLGRLEDEIARHAPKKEQPILLHCQSGMRSGLGTSTLKKLGYGNVLNLGSYGRAKEMLGSR